MAELNPQQCAAVESGDGPQLILAGAGSGKTRTIIHRIGHLIASRGYAPHRILAVTFTNKAAAELKSRLSLLIGDDGGGVVSGTFHAISLRFLRRYADTLGYPKNFLVIDSDDQKTLIKRLLKQHNITTERLHPSYLLGWIEHCKHAGLSPEQSPAQQWNDISLNELYRDYQQQLRHLERMDFSDLILNTVMLLREHPPIAAAIRARFDHVLVDEYQDTNPVQHEWLMLLCAEHHNLTVVGDDDQSIYGWRGADVRHILDFERLWPNPGIHRLEHNYRSCGRILTLANAVIDGNTQRHVKQLRATRGDGEMPQWITCHDEFDEARQIVRHLKERQQRGIAWQDMTILYRSNRQSLPLEQRLREENIPYRVIGGIGFFERMEIKDALAFWALLNHCADAMHLLRIANKPKRGIGAKGLEKLAVDLGKSGLRVAKWLDQLTQGTWPAPLNKLAPLAQLLADIRPHAPELPDYGLWRILEQSGYLKSLQAMGELEAASREENLVTLQSYIELSMASGLTPVEFMDRAALLQSDEENDDNDDALNLMSLHRAKGLEFDTVVLCGVEEGLLPHQRAIDEGETGIAEERRLLYVGITRAKNSLLLTSARQRRVFGDMVYPQPSRFIANLPPDTLQKPAASIPSAMSGPTNITIGAQVQHPSFGEGIVLSMEGSGDAIRVTVQFRLAGTKRLMLKYAALQTI